MIDDLWLGRSIPVPHWPATVLRLGGLGLLIYLIVTASPRPGPHGHGAAILGLLVLGSLSWVVWAVYTEPPARPGGVPVTALAVTAVLGLAGAFLAGLSPSPYAPVFAYVAVFAASLRMDLRWSVPVLAGIAGAIVIASAVWRPPAGGLAQALLIPLGAFLGGLNRRQSRLRTQEEARTAGLAERTRIAREIHDVLAHSLAGLSVQLEAARALLAGHGDPEKALTHVERAHRLAAEGMAETRRAIAALREDTLPLTDLLTALVAEHGDRTGAGATFTVRGTPRALRSGVSLTLYRAAQEALTNSFRHAGGATVEAELRYEARETVLTVTDHHPDGAAQPAAPAGEAPAAASGGYGLTGMRERAELAGGTLRAGPCAGGWRVELRIPDE